MPRRAPTRPARRRAAAPPPAPARSPARRAPKRWWLLATTALLPVTGTALAQSPTGGQVVAGQAAIAQSGNRTTITQRSDRAAIDWQQFNVGAQSTVQFVQPSQGSWTLNRVVGPDPSVIAGRIQANGGVAIVNQSGMVFAGGAQVDVGSLIASAANITNQNFMAGRMVFDGAPRPGARVENRGSITVADRGLAALVGPNVANSGVIRANLGRVALGAAETFVLDLAGDGLIGIDVTRAVTSAPDGGATLVTNSGVIEAAGPGARDRTKSALAGSADSGFFGSSSAGFRPPAGAVNRAPVAASVPRQRPDSGRADPLSPGGPGECQRDTRQSRGVPQRPARPGSTRPSSALTWEFAGSHRNP